MVYQWLLRHWRYKSEILTCIFGIRDQILSLKCHLWIRTESSVWTGEQLSPAQTFLVKHTTLKWLTYNAKLFLHTTAVTEWASTSFLQALRKAYCCLWRVHTHQLLRQTAGRAVWLRCRQETLPLHTLADPTFDQARYVLIWNNLRFS